MRLTCGDCRHLDPAPVPTMSERKIRFCLKRCTWEYADTPRGSPGPWECDKFSLVERLTAP
jgi:hypothetical protein